MKTIDEKLKKVEEHEKEGLESSSRVSDDVRFVYYYGTWAFSERDANLAEEQLMKAGTISAWESLGKLYERAAVSADKLGGSEVVSSGGSCKSRDLLAYWSIRAYLKAGKEDKAIGALTKFSKYESVLLTLCQEIKSEQSQKESEVESPDNRKFNLPDLDKFPSFYKELKRLGEKYMN